MKSARIVFIYCQCCISHQQTISSQQVPLTSFSDWTAAHWMTLDTGFLAMYCACSSASVRTSSMIWPDPGNGMKYVSRYYHTMLVSKLHRPVDPPTLLGDVKFDLQLLLNDVITRISGNISIRVIL